jgi:hypothetical protein
MDREREGAARLTEWDLHIKKLEGLGKRGDYYRCKPFYLFFLCKNIVENKFSS